MAKLKVLTDEQAGILTKADINPQGYGLEYMDESKMILKHYKSGFEVWIRRDGVLSW